MEDTVGMIVERCRFANEVYFSGWIDTEGTIHERLGLTGGSSALVDASSCRMKNRSISGGGCL